MLHSGGNGHVRTACHRLRQRQPRSLQDRYRFEDTAAVPNEDFECRRPLRVCRYPVHRWRVGVQHRDNFTADDNGQRHRVAIGGVAGKRR